MSLIWNKGLAARCDVRLPDEFPGALHGDLRYVPDRTLATDEVPAAAAPDDAITDLERFDALEPGALVWVRGTWLRSFARQVLPRLRAPIVLVSGDNDASLPSELGDEGRAIVTSPLVAHWYTQNYDGTAPIERVSPIPAGVDLHTVAEHSRWGSPVASPDDQAAELESIARSLPPLEERIPRVYCDFTWAGGYGTPCGARLPESRTAIRDLLLRNPLIEHQFDELPRAEMWRRKGQYAASLSPHGHGLDCHRTWESLALGQVVVVPSSPIDPLFDGTTAVPIARWLDVDHPHFVRWLALARAVSEPTRPLTNEHWIARMRSRSSPGSTPAS
jgi:hypothetical protein